MRSDSCSHCVVAAIMGIVAAATGFAAEATKESKASEDYFDPYIQACFHPSPALVFGILSAVITIMTRVYISASFGEAGCCQTDPNSTPISKLLYILSWVASVTAVTLLLTSSVLLLYGTQDDQVGSYNRTCYTVKPGIFATGAILALLSAVFGIAAYIKSTPPPQTATNPAVALPPPQQYPPQRY